MKRAFLLCSQFFLFPLLVSAEDRVTERLPGEEVVTPSGQKMKVWSTKSSDARPRRRERRVIEDLSVLVEPGRSSFPVYKQRRARLKSETSASKSPVENQHASDAEKTAALSTSSPTQTPTHSSPSNRGQPAQQ